MMSRSRSQGTELTIVTGVILFIFGAVFDYIQKYFIMNL